MFARGIARVRREDRPEAAALDLAAQIVGGEGVALLAFEEDGDRREGLEDVEQLLVRRVVGEEVAEVDVPERGRGPRQRRAPPAADADVLRRVLRGQALAVRRNNPFTFSPCC